MPIRSMPNDMYTGSEEQKEPNADNKQQNGSSSVIGKQYHERKEDWLKKVEPYLDPSDENPEEAIRKNREQLRSHPWLVFMIVAIISALVLFMMIPVLDNFYQVEGPNNPLENMKEFISFVAPIIIVVAAIAGTAGYFRFFFASWALVIGHVAGIAAFALTLDTANQSLNLGVYWIVLLSFIGGAIGFLVEFIYSLTRKFHKELSPIMFIGFAAFAAGAFVITQFTLGQEVDLLTYQQASDEVDFQVYEPAYLPEKIAEFEPKLFINDNAVSVYYGNDHYPPPPVIDFLAGIELVQSEKIEELNTEDPEPGVVFLDIGDEMARFTQRRGRATIEWNQVDTHIVLNIYSNITAREMFKIARSLQPALSSSN